MKPIRLLSIGELLWDILPSGKRCGGAPGNLVYHAGVQGLDARLCSAVGNDPAGDELLALIRQRGLKDDFLTRDAHPTGTVTVTLERGIPRYDIHAPAAWDFITAAEPVRRFAAAADAICFGTLAQRGEVSHRTILELAALTPESALRVFDINLRQDFHTPALIQASLEAANVLKVSDEELPELRRIFDLRGDDRTVLAELLRRFQLRFILFTLGKQGSCYLDADRFLRQEIVENGPVVDTVGCGDSFLASFLAAFLQGAAPARALCHAATVSGLVAERNGAMPDDDAFRTAAEGSLRQAVSLKYPAIS